MPGSSTINPACQFDLFVLSFTINKNTNIKDPNMKARERDAILTYVEFQLVKMAKGIEHHVDPDAIGLLYNLAHDVLNDLAETFDAQDELDNPDFVLRDDTP